MEPADRRTRRRRRRRRRTATVTTLIVMVVTGVAIASCTSGSTSAPTTTTTRPGGAAVTSTRSGPPSLEAGVLPWQLPTPLSRAAAVPSGSGLTLLGGLTPPSTSVATVSSVDPQGGTVNSGGTLADPVHDGAAVTLGSTTYVLGGGSPNTVATVQAITTSSGAGAQGRVVGALPRPRSDLAVATMPGPTGRPTAYVVGGYDGTTYEPSVLATTDGTHFTSVATLAVPVRYAAVAATNGKLFAFGGQTATPGTATTATTDIQMIDPQTHQVTVVGHLPQPLYGAAAFVLGGTVYVAGGQVPGGITLTQIWAFVPDTHKLLNAGLLPQAEAFGAYTTVGTGAKATGYILGGEVASQSGPDQAGIASGTLQTVLSLRPSPWGGPAGVPGAGAPYSGTLLIADRGNDRLLALNTSRTVTWHYPSAAMPPPPGGFYFPDDAFFTHGGTAIISNQENNHTIVQIGYPSGQVLWQYGHPGVPGSLPGYLDQPDDAYLLKNGTITVADASNNRILFLSQSGQILGQIGNGVDAHVLGTSLAYPNGDTPLANGDVLVSEINGSYIDEYTPSGKVVWSVQMPTVNYPSDPQQLGPDLYLMTDFDPPAEGRILEFNRAGHISWLYDVTAGDGMLKQPSLAERLPNGLIMVNDDHHDRVVAIDPTDNAIVWQYGLTGVSGTATGMLSIPDGFDNLLPNGTTPTHPQTG